ncbi:MAG: alkaline phosphatase D family protein, partial [Acidimicrobiales bacterium]
MERRAFLKLGVGGATLAIGGRLIWPDPVRADPLPGPFAHGVASGDPEPNAVIIWTRVTPSPDAVPGSLAGPATVVAWEVASDEAFTGVVSAGTVMSDPLTDHTVKVDVGGLAPATGYWYRFHALGARSIVGRTRTAPAEDAVVDALRLGIVSCSNWEGGYFSAYRHLAERDDLDLVLHLGDYLYEYGQGGYGPGSGFGRVHDPAVEMVALSDYRRRHAQYKTDPDLRLLHQRYPWVTTWDDHETTNDAWADGAENHQDGEGAWAVRKLAARQAYFEWMPVRVTSEAEPYRIWRHLAFGSLADLFVLDERTYRSQPVPSAAAGFLATDPAMGDPRRTMLGPDQLEWLENGLTSSTACWKLVANPVMFTPLLLTPDLPDLGGLALLLLQLLAATNLTLPIAINPDQWDGYRAEQQRLISSIGSHAVDGVVFLTGDIHSSWASDIPADAGAYLPIEGFNNSVAVEFVGTSVTSDSLVGTIEGLGLPAADTLAQVIELVVPVQNRWLRYFEGRSNGFGVFEVTRDRAQFDWWFVSDRTDPRATAAVAQSWLTRAGTNRLDRAPGPLGSRRTEVASAPVAQPVETEPLGLVAAAGDATPAGVGDRLPATGAGLG